MPAYGRKVPPDWNHVSKYPLRLAAAAPVKVERILPVPANTPDRYNQDTSSACTSVSALTERTAKRRPPLRWFDWRWEWDRNKELDGFPNTNPGDNEGSSVRAAMDVLRTLGPRQVANGKSLPPNLALGIVRNEWATTVDGVRAAILGGSICILGINWYERWEQTQGKGGEEWIGLGQWGRIVGGHAIACIGASDRRQAVLLSNTWGTGWGKAGRCWLPYGALGKLIVAEGECAVPIDASPGA